MKNLLIFSIGVLLLSINPFNSTEVKAQQDAEFSMYMFNGLIINPGYAGSRERWSLTALYRHQWAGFGDGVPRTFTASAHGPLLDDRIGIGASVTSDQIGPTSMFQVTGDFAYRIPIALDKKWGGRLCPGISAQFTNYTQRWDELTQSQGGDPSFGQRTNVYNPNFGVGLYWYSKQFYVGWSIPNLLNASLDNRFAYEGTDLVARRYRHMFITAGAIIKLNDNLKLKPSILFKYVNHAPFQGDYNVSLLIKEALWVGVSFRSSFHEPVALVGMIEYMFAKRVRLGYAYDYTFTDIGQYQSGTHEIMLGYEFGQTEKYLTPRRMSYF